LLFAIVLSISLAIIVSPAYATRIIDVEKQLDVRKALLEKTLTDLTSYKKIFPDLIKDVKIDSSDKNKAKFVVSTPLGTKEADIKSTINPDGTFVVNVLSGDLKGSTITTSLKERNGFDGTPHGGTVVNTKLVLEASWWIPLSVVGDSDIQNAVGNGFYELGNYVKVQYPEPKTQPFNVNYEKNTVPKLDAAKKLDPKKEAAKIQLVQSTKEMTKIVKTSKEKVQTISEKKEAAKKLVTERQTKPTAIIPVQQESLQAKAKPLPLQNSLTLDPFPSTVHIGDTVVFSGRLSLSGTNPAGATVYIKDEDPLGNDDMMAGGIVDSSGRFYIPWTAKSMDFDSIADVYAVFEGTDIHQRMTTCGASCTNTVPLTVR